MTNITKWRLVLCGAVLAAGSARALSQNLLINPGLETFASISTDLPTTYALWSHDVAAIVTAQNGITPLHGSRMLHLIYTSPYGPMDASQCEVYQLVDVVGYAELIQSGRATAISSAWFNRIAGDSQTDRQFGLEFRAYDGSASTFPEQLNTDELARITYTFSSDAHTSTWEPIDLIFSIPRDTTFLALRVFATEDVYNDFSGMELDGHYADAMSLTIVPEPASLFLLAFGGVAVLRTARKTRRAIAR